MSGIASVSLKSLSSSRTALRLTGVRVAVWRCVRCSRLLPVRLASSCGLGRCLPPWARASDLLLQQAEFLQVVRGEADQVALAGDGDLQRLANPPRRVGGEAGAVAHVEAVDRLHQPADGFLQQVGVREAVVAEPLGDVGGEADVGAGEPVLEVDVAVAEAADGDDFAAVFGAVFADELGHRPRFERRPDGAQSLGKWRSSTRTSSLLQSQKLVSSSRSSSGVSRSEEKVVSEVSSTLAV